jgi:hypothetical protein
MNYCKVFLIIGLSIFATNAISQQNKRLSVSGKPQDEAYCAILGDTRIPDKKCLGEDPKNHTTIVRTTYAINYAFYMSQTNNTASCKTIEFAQPLLNYLNRNKIAFKETHSVDSTGTSVSCNFSFIIDKKEDLCSKDTINVLQNDGKLTKQELTKANNWNQTRTSFTEACK